MEAEIEVLEPGLFSTIQDEGRFHFRKLPSASPYQGNRCGIAASTFPKL